MEISIHALREEGDTAHIFGQVVRVISIHALREEGDSEGRAFFYPLNIISIHALREEGDTGRCMKQATLEYFYPRPPRGGRHHYGCNSVSGRGISIHALREEGDPGPSTARRRRRQFLSTPSARRATYVFRPHKPR